MKDYDIKDTNKKAIQFYRKVYIKKSIHRDAI